MKNKILLKIILYFIFLFNNTNILGITYPVTPAEPKVENTESNEDIEKKIEKKENNTANKKIQVKITLGSTDELIGFIYAPVKITFSHYKNGLMYKKTVDPVEINEIEILEYKKKKINNLTDGDLFEFEPNWIKINLKNKKSYYIREIFSFIRSFDITTTDGTTKIYAFFADTFNNKKGWSEVKSLDPEYHKNKAHPQAVYKIQIIDIPDIQEE
ncbi:MAG: hypothetical protein OEZ22_05575 [Spirochaetia bacterium]|nr:hypothetical protein [Spirochaetia bacterium]